jgi:hypothetical protein
MKKLFAFLNGMAEFRSRYTTHYSKYSHMCAYDRGRELAHRLTLRRFEV